MKRHEALHPLSRDHHNVLVHARRLRGLDARVDAATARRRFLSCAPILELHFEEEERTVAPRIGDEALRRRLLDEHADLRRRIGALPMASGPEQIAFGESLRLHVRFEEDVLYPRLETSLPRDELSTVAQEGSAFRADRRPDSIAGSEACFL
jgi:hypothetical protein